MTSSKRCRVGGLDYLEGHAAHPPGPASVRGLYEWPAHALDIIESSPRKQLKANFISNLQNGIHWWSFYTCKGTDGTALHLLRTAAVARGWIDATLQPFNLQHASDSDMESRTILEK